jgi:WD40 repeat protein
LDEKPIVYYPPQFTILILDRYLDSTRLVTVSEDGGINVCDIDGKVIHSGRNPNGPIRAAATDRAGQVLLTAGDNGELLLWNTSGVSQVAALAVC